MKFLTTNFIKCPIKACDASEDSFPLKFEECKLEQEEQTFNAGFITAMLERLDWSAVVEVAKELGNNSLPAEKPESFDETALQQLHSLLLETQIVEGQMVCRNCGHIYYIKDSIANMLLPPHLAK